jgi:hypothetical protein
MDTHVEKASEYQAKQKKGREEKQIRAAADEVGVQSLLPVTRFFLK